MGAHVAGVATLRDSTVWVLSTVCGSSSRCPPCNWRKSNRRLRRCRYEVSICLIGSSHIELCTNLRANTSAVSNLDLGDFGSDFDDLANDLMSYAEGKGNVLSPSTGDGVNIRSANTTGVN
jgi:hypothetical protein